MSIIINLDIINSLFKNNEREEAKFIKNLIRYNKAHKRYRPYKIKKINNNNIKVEPDESCTDESGTDESGIDKDYTDESISTIESEDDVKKRSRAPNKYNLFVRKNFPIIQDNNPDLPHADLMKLLAEKYNDLKDNNYQ